MTLYEWPAWAMCAEEGGTHAEVVDHHDDGPPRAGRPLLRGLRLPRNILTSVATRTVTLVVTCPVQLLGDDV